MTYEPGHLADRVGNRRPRNRWLRLLIVVLTISSVAVLMLSGLVVARKLGIDPKELQGAGFAVRPETVSIFLIFQFLQILIVLVAHRLLHQRPLRELGFKSPILRTFGTGFGLGAALVGARVLWIVLLLKLLPGGDVGIEWAVPNGTSIASLLFHYFFFFFVFLTANSFGEEIVFRCYPVEQFRDRPRMLTIAVGAASLIFAAIHFIIGTFSIEWFVGLVGFAVIAAYMYFRWQTIWLVVGLHSGASFISFSLGGNWKMGGLLRLLPTVPETSPWLGVLFIGIDAALFALVFWLVFRFGKRGDCRYPAKKQSQQPGGTNENNVDCFNSEQKV